MDILLKIVPYSAFLLLYLGWLWGNNRLGTRIKAKGSPSFLEGELLIALGVVFLFGSVGLLSGFFDLMLTVLLFLALHFGVILRPILSSTLSASPIAARLVTASIKLNYPWFQKVTFGIMVIAVILFPIVCAYFYFSNDANSDYMTRRVLQTVIGFVFVAGGPVLVLSALIIASPYIDENSRLAILIHHFTTIAPTAIYLSILLWSFGFGSDAVEGTFLNKTVIMSPWFVLIIFGYFCCMALVPYIIGSLRGKRARKQLLRKQQEWIDRMVHMINLPTPKLYHVKLGQLTKDLDDRQNKFVEGDIFVRDFDMLEDQINVEAKPKGELAAELEEIDPRLRYVAFLHEFRQDIHEVVEELSNVTDESKRIERARFFAEAHERKIQELAKEADKEVQFKSPVLAIGTFVLAALASPVVERIGGWLWVGFGSELR